MSFDWSLFASALGVIVQRLPLVLMIVAAASVLALGLGLVFALAARSGHALLRVPVGFVAEFIRRTPLLVQVYAVFYVLPEIGIYLSGVTAGIVALGVYQAAFVSQIYQGGIANVPRGQWDAAIALNVPRLDVWRRIVLPQAVPPMIPMLGNYLLLLLKETALLSTITVVELMGAAMIIGNQTYRYLEPITAVGLIYLAICWPTAILLRRYENALLADGRTEA